MDDASEVKKILKSERQAIVLMATSIFLCILLLVIYFVFVKNQVNDCFPNFLILILFSASIALFIFGGIEKAKSTGSFTGKLFGLDVTFGGPAALLLIMVLIGKEYIPCNEPSINLTVNFFSKDKTKNKIEGSVMLTCGAYTPITAAVYNGQTTFRNLPLQLKGSQALLRPQIPGFEKLPDSVLIPVNDSFINYYLTPETTEIHGNVVDANNLIVKNCRLDFENGLAVTYTDSSGNFRVRIPVSEGTQLTLKIFVQDIIRYDNPIIVSSQNSKTLKF